MRYEISIQNYQNTDCQHTDNISRFCNSFVSVAEHTLGTTKVTRLGEKELSKLLDTRLTIGKGHVFPFNKIQLSDVCLYDRQGDTLLYAQKLIAGFAWQELLQKRLVFTTVQLYDFEVSLQKENTNSPLNLQFIIDRFKKNEPSAIDLHSQVNTILARRGKINYDVASKNDRHKGASTRTT